MGKLIVFEGTDGSGKSTQFSLLTRRLEARGVDFRTMVFPQSDPAAVYPAGCAAGLRRFDL